MATLVLSAATAAAGPALINAGIGLGLSFGQGIMVSNVMTGLAGLTGGMIDRALLGPSTASHAEGPRLSDIQIQASSEGAPIPRAYGRVRLAGQVIWATRFKEVADTEEVGAGKGGPAAGKAEVTEYRYYVSFAVALCEGVVSRIGRVWADGKPLNLAGLIHRVYPGAEDQEPDALIEAVEGVGNVPAFRGVAYVVFEDLPLAQFGNRVPQLTFEVIRRVPTEENSAEALIRAVDLIPASGEFVYATESVMRDLGNGVTQAETLNNNMGSPDFVESLDQLEDILPNCRSVLLVTAWFGTDLRAAQCRLRPGIEHRDKETYPLTWQVAGESRASAHLVSRRDGIPVYGGTPADSVVVQAIQEMRSRDLRVVFYPFILMDVPAQNALPNPYDPAVAQPAFPWRGRITIYPAPGVSGSPDGGAAARDQVTAFFEQYRAMVLHYARLCQAAGGVDAFVIGSELRGLTTVRDGPGSYPAVAELRRLVAEVRAILGPAVKLSYAADWSEYFGHQPQDGSGDVYFHLDPLWADENIDFIGIDNYMPMSDWRDGLGHLDAEAGWESIYDLDYLHSNIRGGEGYDWYYASAGDRENQIRTAVRDGGYGKDWIFRYKDLWNWWANTHHDRPHGSESSAPTAWIPRSKPIWFTEAGCPAVDKGTNQPNVFYDPKSSESALPYFSRGFRDDLIQRRYIEALYSFWDPGRGNNAWSDLYDGWMINPADIFIWTWDARPWPDFPSRYDVWGDAENWKLGHWLTGRMGMAPLSQLVAALCREVGFTRYDVSHLRGLVTGFVLDRILSPRQALESLMLAYQFDAVESDGLIRFCHRDQRPLITLAPEDLVSQDADAGAFRLTRGQETELPVAAKLSYIDGTADYRQAAVEARRLAVSSARVATAALPIVMEQSQVQALVDSWLQEAWVMRERAEFVLPPSRLALDPGDVVALALPDRRYELRLTQIEDALGRTAAAVRTEASIYDLVPGPDRTHRLATVSVYGRPLVEFLDLPLLTGEEVPQAPHVAAFASPWPGGVGIFSSPGESGFRLNRSVRSPATMGELLAPLAPGPTDRWDRANALLVRLYHGVLESRAELVVLMGENAAAVRNGTGEWEVLQFQTAELVGVNTYRLRLLLRGQAGTEAAMQGTVPAGARFILLNRALPQLDLKLAERNLPLNWRYGPLPLPIGDMTYQTRQVAFRGVGLRPYSPVHVRASRSADGGLLLNWIRRTRIGGDSWEGEVPLGEESESYQVDVLDQPGGAVVRTLSTSSPSVTYTAAQQTTDFGAIPAQVTVRVHQISAIYGRGTGREVTINV